MVTIHQKLLNAASSTSAAVATPKAFKYVETGRLTHIVEWSSGAASGAVVIEGADDPDYAGTWAPIATVNFSSGAHASYVSHEGPWGAIRHRVATAVSNGTVTSYIRGTA